jgi:hypothetical protein
MNSNDLKVIFSKKSDHWSTPKKIYDHFIKLGYLDPCPLNSEFDNLNKDFGNNKLYINPPYSDINSWITFAFNHYVKYHRKIIMLLPSRTDTKWFHRLLDLQELFDIHFTFIKGRLKFGNSTNSAPFPSLFVSFGSPPVGVPL